MNGHPTKPQRCRHTTLRNITFFKFTDRLHNHTLQQYCCRVVAATVATLVATAATTATVVATVVATVSTVVAAQLLCQQLQHLLQQSHRLMQ